MSGTGGIQEFERKFVPLHWPTILHDPDYYWQSYIENGVGLTARIRQEGPKKVLQFKLRILGSSPFESPPFDLSSSPEIFEKLKEWANSSTKPKTIEKNRYTVQPAQSGGAKECVVDYFLGKVSGKMMAEAEFETKEEMNAWQPPQWLVDVGFKEVTGDLRYNNEWIAEHGWPEEV